jgi:hypothetical protein
MFEKLRVIDVSLFVPGSTGFGGSIKCGIFLRRHVSKGAVRPAPVVIPS